MPPQHLMRHVHSTDGRRPGHPAGGVPVHSVGRQYARAAAYTMLIITRALPRRQPRHINTIWTTDIMAPEDCPAVAGMRYFYSVFPPFCPWAHMSGLSTLVRAPLSYKREGTRRYKADPTYTLTHTRTHKFIQSLKLNTSHNGVGYYAPTA